MGHHQLAHDSREKQAQGCMVDVIIPTNLVCVLFDPAIPTSSFNYIVCCIYSDFVKLWMHACMKVMCTINAHAFTYGQL